MRKRAMTLSIGQLTARGKARGCGKTARKACSDAASWAHSFGGKLTPRADAAKGRRVVLRIYRKEGRRWKVVRTVRVKLTAKKTWSARIAPGKLPRGTYYAQATTGPTDSTMAATSRKTWLTVT